MNATSTRLTVKVDFENNSEEWWIALDATYPAFANCLRWVGAAVISSDLMPALTSLPGFANGPEYAREALIASNADAEDLDAWTVFETLS